MGLALKLDQRTALVSGGSRGIGRAICRLLAGAGAKVMVGATRREKAQTTAAEIQAAGGTAKIVLGDLSRPETAGDYVRATIDAFGGLDILVNNAGIWEDGAIDDLTPEMLSRTLRVNLESAFHLCRESVSFLKSSPAGRIVNITSTASLMGEPGHAPYAASKGGLDALTRSLAVELGPAGITVNSVAPGWTETEMTRADLATELGARLRREIPLGKVATADDVAYAVAFLVSDWAGHISGVTLPVEGAYRIRR